MENEMKEFTKLAENDFITAKGMIMIALTVEIIVQTFALIIQPTDWWIWQLLGFITATNLGALILGIVAQRSAERISETYRTIFTPDFYFTVKAITDFRKIIEDAIYYGLDALIQKSVKQRKTVN